MDNIMEAVRACLEQASGVKTVRERTRVRGEYPLLAVAVREESTTLLAGGRQAEHAYHVTVTAASDRQREDNTALLARLPDILLRGVPMETQDGRRMLHPLNIATKGEELTFSLVLCVPVSGLSEGETGAPDKMKTLHFGVQ